MSANVISHHAPHGKRSNAGSLIVRRTGVIVAAVLGVVAASLLAPALRPASQTPAPEAHPPARLEAPPPAAPAEFIAVDAVDLAGAPIAHRPVRRAARHVAGVPLDANAALEPAGYEILSAAELEGISQARE